MADLRWPRNCPVRAVAGGPAGRVLSAGPGEREAVVVWTDDADGPETVHDPDLLLYAVDEPLVYGERVRRSGGRAGSVTRVEPGPLVYVSWDGADGEAGPFGPWALDRDLGPAHLLRLDVIESVVTLRASTGVLSHG